MAQRFKDKTAIITGASSGIGAAAARQFIIEGANVALIARNKDNLDKIVEQTGSEKAIAISVDLTDLDKMSAVLQVDMLTTVFIGNSASTGYLDFLDFIYTPRGYDKRYDLT